MRIALQTSTTYNVFSILQLPIPQGRSSKVPLQNCIDAFFNTEILDKDDAWFVSSFRVCGHILK
jgi:ubiquitin carboxyl-terminal hydrolase 8